MLALSFSVSSVAVEQRPADAAWFTEGYVWSSGATKWYGSLFLRMQTDGNFVLYQQGPGSAVPLWATGTNGNPGAWAIYQGDGNLVVYSSSNVPLWASNTHGNLGDTLVLSADGNLQIFGSSSQLRWSSWTSQTPSSGSVPGAGPFLDNWRQADNWIHTHATSESNAADRAEWQWRFDGPGGENRYEPTDLSFVKKSSVDAHTDLYWNVTPASNMTNLGAAAEVACQTPISSTVCDRFRLKISDTADNLSSHMQNNLICHEIGHSVGFGVGHGWVESSCLTGGDNTRLGWWEKAQINATY